MSPRKKTATPAKRTPASTPSTPSPCCREWNEFPTSSRSWGWQVIHRLAHSRTTFSEPTVAALAYLDTEQARALIADAVNFRWIAHTDQRGIYVGRLTAWKR